jgi:hypothetical protein
MTASANQVPVSVDYTGRDYYALREQLIARVQERVPGWKGNDANDFGLALVEAFAYMGDLINYYIDRVANESYLGTATQRETLLNIANMYGYSPAGYVSAIAPLTFTSRGGYQGPIGATIIEDGTIDTTVHTGIAKLIVPNDQPFSTDDRVVISGVPTIVTGTLGGDSSSTTLAFTTALGLF